MIQFPVADAFVNCVQLVFIIDGHADQSVSTNVIKSLKSKLRAGVLLYPKLKSVNVTEESANHG